MLGELRERLEKAAADMAGEIQFGLDDTAEGAAELRAAAETAQAFVEQLDINLGFTPRCDLAMAALLSYAPAANNSARKIIIEHAIATVRPKSVRPSAIRGLLGKVLS